MSKDVHCSVVPSSENDAKTAEGMHKYSDKSTNCNMLIKQVLEEC